MHEQYPLYSYKYYYEEIKEMKSMEKYRKMQSIEEVFIREHV